MISQKIRNNATISYFFLGWLFLLAKNNPNFSDPFIKHHAKMATKGHALFFVSYFFYNYFLSSHFSYSLPIIQITIDHCIDIIFFAFLTFFIIHGAYASQKNKWDEETRKGDSFFSQKGRSFHFDGTSEAQKIILFLSHTPFVGMVIAKRFPNVVTTTGARVSSLFGCIYLLSFTSDNFGSLSMILLFVGIFLLLTLAVSLFINNNYTVPHFFERIPGIESLYLIARTLPQYLVDTVAMIFGRKDSLSFVNQLKETQEKDRNFRATLQSYFTDKTLPFKAYWIFIPFLNIVFLPKLFLSRTTEYVLAIGQGLVITLLAIVIGFFYSFTSPIELFLLFPMFYGIASLESDVFIRIPFIYEIYAILNALSFGFLNNTKRIRSVQKQDMNVSYKVE